MSSLTSRADILLEVKDLRTYFYTDDGVVKAVDGVDLDVYPGEIFGLVGESGCGKSVSALSILRLIEAPGKIVAGDIHFDGTSLMQLSAQEMDELRGMRISMIFQQPRSSLNPVFSVGAQVAEVFQIHQNIKKDDAWDEAVKLLQQVGIPDPEERALAYPHQMSGGQAQRVMIAMALALNPKLLIADEPTSALDVTIQAQILDLIRGLSHERNTAVILITHDLGVISEMADRVAVMYAGRVVEQANIDELFDKPRQPYTQGLMNSMPIIGKKVETLKTIPGTVPNLVDMPPGCRFASRCVARAEYNLKICTDKEPDLIEFDNDHWVRCWLYQSHDGHLAPLSM
jgi:oligopeptide/dipeptide ABC transporter ATP-binding protein